MLDQARALTFASPIAAVAHQLILAATPNGDGLEEDAIVIRFWEKLIGIDRAAKK